MSFSRGCNGYTSHFWVGEDLIYRISEPCCRIRRGKMGSRAWLRFTDPCQDTEISKVANQVLSPIASTNTGDFVSDHKRSERSHLLSLRVWGSKLKREQHLWNTFQ